MASMSNRNQLIRKGKLLFRAQIPFKSFQFLRMVFKKNPLRKEIFIDTEFGKVRTLWYGFDNKQKTPVFFDLHGGGFILGSADMDEKINLKINHDIGCKVISIDYAKAPDYPFPAAVNQVYAVVGHVFEKAESNAIDVSKMAIGGHSAGGNLSTVTCMKAKKEGEFQFVCQVLDYPPLDLATDPLDKPQPKGCIPPGMATIFNACYVDPKQAKDPCVSPVYAFREDLEGLPPALFILAGRDSLHDEGVKYCEMLKTAGTVTECCDYPDAIHGFTLKPSDNTTNALEKIAAFLNKYLF